MKQITKQEYEVAKNHGLLYDGKTAHPGMDRVVLNRALYNNNTSGRNFVRCKNGHVYVTEGNEGILNSINYFMKKEHGCD